MFLFQELQRRISDSVHTPKSPLKRGLNNSDYDKDANIVGLEILNASKRMENPRSVEYAIAD
jgi:hypothetical protein